MKTNTAESADKYYRANFAIPFEHKDALRTLVGNLKLRSSGELMAVLASAPEQATEALKSLVQDYRKLSELERQGAEEKKKIRKQLMDRLKGMSIADLEKITLSTGPAASDEVPAGPNEGVTGGAAV